MPQKDIEKHNKAHKANTNLITYERNYKLIKTLILTPFAYIQMVLKIVL